MPFETPFISICVHPPSPPPIDATYEYISTSGHIHMIYHQAICFIPRSLLLITTCTNVLSMFPLHVATLNCNLIERCKTPAFRSWTTAHEFGHFLLQRFFNHRHLKDYILLWEAALSRPGKNAFKERVQKSQPAPNSQYTHCCIYAFKSSTIYIPDNTQGGTNIDHELI